jgi:hypothetical protein
MRGGEDLGALSLASERNGTIDLWYSPNASNISCYGTLSRLHHFLVHPHSAARYNFVQSHLPVPARWGAAIPLNYSFQLLPGHCTDDKTTEW